MTSRAQTARTILLMGPPGAGKGTQASHIVEHYGLRHIATGDVLRTAVSDGTELGVQAQEYMAAGKLVPDEIIIGVLRDLIGGLDESTGVLLDGFPRTCPQAEALSEMLDDLDRSVDVALDIRVPREVLITRLSSRWICRSCQRPYNVVSSPPAEPGVCDICSGELYQREDDRPEAVAKRLDVYEEQTAPVSEWYERRGLLRRIDGNQPPADVQDEIDQAIEGVRA